MFVLVHLLVLAARVAMRLPRLRVPEKGWALLAVLLVELAACWRLCKKAGLPGWVAVVPVLNAWMLLRVAGRSGLWFLGFFVPVLNLVALAAFSTGLARAFAKGLGWAAALFFLTPLALPVLGFGRSRYVGPRRVR